MRQLLKLTLYVIAGFIGFTALISSVMMLSVGSYTAYRLSLKITFFISLVVSFFSIVQIIRLNKAWKINQVERASEIWAEWVVEGDEWKQYKQTYTSDKKIQKDAFIYSMIASIIWFLFILLLVSTATQLSTAIVTSLTSTIVFGVFLFLLINWISKKKVNHLAVASKVHVKANRELILINNKPVFLNTQGLKPCSINMEEKNGVLSVLILLESITPQRRITQEQRIPYSLADKDIVSAYFDRIRKAYNIN